ncbi:MAG: tetratricopeptide repeat protein [Acidobacteria bacterium]|nr:tetratricopeptide repeat protein [Acidobacteriota bacterium]
MPGPAIAEGAIAWWSLPLGIVLALAAIFRIAYFLQYRAESVFFDAPFLDAFIYDSWARRIAAGEWFPKDAFYFAPGYPYALAVFYKVIAATVGAAYALQMALGLLNIVLIRRLAALAFGSRVADVAAALAALYASFPFLESKLMSPTLSLSLLLAALTMLVGATSRGGARRWALAGCLLGATSLVRPESLLAAPFVVLWIRLWGGRAAPGAKGTSWRIAALALLAGWAIPILPVTLHNAAHGGGSTLISSQGGITFYQSNNPRARGLYVFLSKEGFSGAPERQAEEEKGIAEKALGRPLTRSEVSSYWFSKGLAFVRSDPGRFAWLVGMKFLRFIGSYEYSTEYILYVEREQVWLLWLPFVPFALLVALAAPAIARALGAASWKATIAGGALGPGALNPAGWLLLIALASNLATVLMFYVSSRYRLPSAPSLIAFAACTVVAGWDAWRGGRRGAAGALAGIVAAVFLLAHFERDDSATIQEANVHYNSGNIWAGRKEPERAVAEYRRALSMDDSRYETWFNLGNSLRDLGRPQEAADAYGRAAGRRPQFWNAHLRRAQALEAASDWAGAKESYEKAAALHDGEFDVELGLGRVAARMGDRATALRHLDRALQIRPGNPAAAAERGKL